MSGTGGLSSGEVLTGGLVGRGWWLVVDEEAGPERVVAGPFADRADARWAATAHEGARPVHGLRSEDGVLRRRPSPDEWAWLAHLGEQLTRLPEDWDEGLDDDDPLATLVVELAAAVAEAGLPLSASAGPVGGVCLTPEPGLAGVVVSWRQHDRMSVDRVHGAAADTAVQQVMNRALADVLRTRGFAVDSFGEDAGHVVRPGG